MHLSSNRMWFFLWFLPLVIIENILFAKKKSWKIKFTCQWSNYDVNLRDVLKSKFFLTYIFPFRFWSDSNDDKHWKEGYFSFYGNDLLFLFFFLHENRNSRWIQNKHEMSSAILQEFLSFLINIFICIYLWIVDILVV